MSTRYFQFIEGNSRKFWEISVHGIETAVRFGRIGTQGQRQVKEFPDEGQARDHADSLVRSKVKKGYVEASRP